MGFNFAMSQIEDARSRFNQFFHLDAAASNTGNQNQCIRIHASAEFHGLRITGKKIEAFEIALRAELRHRSHRGKIGTPSAKRGNDHNIRLHLRFPAEFQTEIVALPVAFLDGGKNVCLEFRLHACASVDDTRNRGNTCSALPGNIPDGDLVLHCIQSVLNRLFPHTIRERRKKANLLFFSAAHFRPI